VQIGVGSGVIYDPDGYILTAAHVVEGANIFRVKLYDGTVLDATVVGADSANDIAVVQVQREGLEAAALAVGEPLRAGQLAIAVGSPWGLDATVTAGIVSAVNRPILANSGGFYVNMIQTDASINPGNSGGALVNREGKIIGINVSIYSTSGANDGVGFAVPIDRAFRVATALTDGGAFEPGLLGVRGSYASVNETPGAVITEVSAGSAADDAGIRIGDVVVSLNDQAVTGIDDLSALVRSYQAGETVVVGIIRDGEPMELGVTLGSANEAGG
jgi:S1-C subfamily serine protease